MTGMQIVHGNDGDESMTTSFLIFLGRTCPTFRNQSFINGVYFAFASRLVAKLLRGSYLNRQGRVASPGPPCL